MNRLKAAFYQFIHVGDLFGPHMTFTRFTSDQEQVISTFPPKETFNGVFPSLGIFEVGDHGTSIRKIEVWDL